MLFIPDHGSAPFPPQLHKGIDPKYINALLRHGELFIGSTDHYRATPSTTPGIQDPNDSRAVHFVENQIAFPLNKGPLPDPINKFLRVQPGMTGGIVRLDNVDLEDEAHAYCFSTALTIDAAKSVRPECGITILNPQRFGQLITAALYSNDIIRPEMAYGECTYTAVRQDWRQAIHQAPTLFRKPPDYSHQKEFRYLWFPKGGRLVDKHLIIRIPAITALVQQAWP